MINIPVNSGFLLINKPTGITSFGCISYLKRILKQKIKIGHAGTLDPFASGLLIVALGREATRLIDVCMKMEKTYIATGKCGELTDTLDFTGTVIETTDIIPSQEALHNTIVSFGDSYEQIPPLYSALQYQGQRLYLLARQKLMNVELLQEVAKTKSRTIHFYDFQLLSYESPFFIIQARVSPGTYIRTLVNDVAVRAGSYATTYTLVRTAIGHYTLAQATDLGAINTIEDINSLIIPVDTISL